MSNDVISQINDCKQTFSNLPGECEREYESKLTNLISSGKFNEEIFVSILTQFYNDKDNYNDIQYPSEEKIAYAAFYCINILYRHNLNYDKLQEYLNIYKECFEHHATFHYLQILKSMNIAEDLEDHENDYLSHLFSFSSEHKHNAGFVHSFPVLYVTIYENNSDNLEFIKTIRNKWGNKAKKAIESAIDLDPTYALYYCTRGRMELINEDYSSAKKDIEKAIRLENANRKDGYSLRISSYRGYQLQITLKKMMDISQVKAEIENLKKVNISNIEILTFFSAIITFILGSLSLAKNYNSLEATSLIIVFMGTLIVGFSLFSILLQFDYYKSKQYILINFLTALIGIIFVIIGIYCVVVTNQYFKITNWNTIISMLIHKGFSIFN